MFAFTYLRMNPELFQADKWRRFVAFVKKMKMITMANRAQIPPNNGILIAMIVIEIQHVDFIPLIWKAICVGEGTCYIYLTWRF
ncbi:putative beta-amylase [Helianthus anomalus]